MEVNKMIGKELRKIGNIIVKEDQKLSDYTSFKIGGPAKYFILVNDANSLIKVLELCLRFEEKHLLIGNGSNLLFSDSGYDGIVIKGHGDFNKTWVKDNSLYAGSSVLLSKAANLALANNLQGLEFASGIPGTIGGGVLMNAGAYGGEIKDFCKRVTYLDFKALLNKGEDLIKDYKGEEIAFDYRMSIFQETKDIILGAEFLLNKVSDKEIIREKMQDLNKRRRDKQPLEYPSAGSTFKRPRGNFAAKLIEECGLKGYQIGGAMVSEKHSGFIINKDKASSKDVRQLIEYVKNFVYNKTGIILETEVRIID